MRLTVRVAPGSTKTGVSRLGQGDDAAIDSQVPSLRVAVSARAVDGKATDAALALIANALGVRERQVRLVTGSRSRTKIVEIDADDVQVLDALARLPVKTATDA